MDTNLQTLYQQFLEFVQKGNADDAKEFLVAHINDFPDDLQREVVFSLFEDGIEKAAAKSDILAAASAVAQGIEGLGRLQSKIRDELKVLDIEKGLAQS